MHTFWALIWATVTFLVAVARMDEFIGPKDCAVPLAGVHYAA